MKRTPHASGSNTVLLVARLAYVGILLLATLLPFGFDADPSAVSLRLARALNPPIAPRDAVDAARNLTLFAGWGALWVVTSRGRHALAVVITATLTGTGLSFAVEILQLLSTMRTTSVLDLVTNMSGSLGGALAIVFFTAAIARTRGRPVFVGIPAFTFAFAYLGTVFLEALLPLLRWSTLPGAAGGPFARLGTALRFFQVESILAIPVFDVLLFFPAGAFSVAALVELKRGYRQAAWLVGLTGFGLAGLAELGRGTLGQPIELGAIFSHGVGIAVGAWATARWLPGLSRRLRGPARPLALLSGYTLILLLWAWRPFLPEFDLQAIASLLAWRRLVPLQLHGTQIGLFSVADVIESFLLYLPLGGLLAVWPLRRHGALAHLFPVLYLAGLSEAGQILVLGRFFDVTDMLVACSGGAIGWILVRRAGFKPYGELWSAFGSLSATRRRLG